MEKTRRLKKWQVAVFFAVSMATLVARRPDAVLRPQFWAEDGAVWYAQAHELGPAAPFLRTQDGYFSTFLRIVGAAAQAMPLAAAPLFFAIVAFAVQAAPAAFFLSRRFEKAVPHPASRLGISLLYLAMPNVGEILGNATNAQWHLALLALMVLIAEPAASAAWRAFDVAVLALAGLSGPYAVFLAPLAFLRWRAEGDPRRRTQTLLLASCAAVQAAALILLNGASRFHTAPRAVPGALAGIMEKQVFGGGLVGVGGYTLLTKGHPMIAAAFAALAVAGCVLVAYAFVRGPWQLRHLIAFAAACLAASLAAPNLGHLNATTLFAAKAWQSMLDSSSGSRYWFLPVLAWLVTLAWATSRENPMPLRAASSAALLLVSIGVASDFRAPAPMDARFADEVRRYDALPEGRVIEMPLTPPGWTMTLTKR